MSYSVLSGDVISYTSLDPKSRKLLLEELTLFLKQLDVQFDSFSRIIKGDYLECVIPQAGEGLRVALAIKGFIKSLAVQATSNIETSRFRLFKTYGIRIAIGYGELTHYDPKEGIIDGEAIYLSGRTIAGKTTFNKERITIKNTLFFASDKTDLNERFEVIFNLLDVLLAKATARQCEVLYLKLLGLSEEEISAKLGIGQSAVNQHSTSVGWSAIESAVDYFQKILS